MRAGPEAIDCRRSVPPLPGVIAAAGYCLERKQMLPPFFSMVFLSFAITICVFSSLHASIEVSKKLVSSFVSVNRQARLQDLADIVRIFVFCPSRANSHFRFFRERAFHERAFVNGAVNVRLPVDHFTALSIPAHSRMSSPEKTSLLITMGLMVSKIRDSKCGSSVFGGDRVARRVGSERRTWVRGLRSLV